MKSIVAFMLCLFFGTIFAVEYTVNVAYMSTDGKWIFDRYFPSNLDIHPGDTVNFITQVADTNTVTFSPVVQSLFVKTTPSGGKVFNSLAIEPFGGNSISSPNQTISSGLLIFDTDTNTTTPFLLSFTEVGTFPYFSLYHLPQMTGVINVVDLSVDVLTPSEVSEQSQATIQNLQDTIVPDLFVVKTVNTKVPSSRPGPNGNVWTVRMVGDLNTNANLVRFVPASIDILEGDSVEFVNDGIDLHTATFNSSGVFGEDTITDPVTGETVFSGVAAQTVGGEDTLYTGGYANSGIVYPLSFMNSGNTTTFRHSWFLTFTKAGVFPFQCDFHDGLGMVGTVQVFARV